MITLANWQERMSEDMRLRDLRLKTQEAYRRAVRQFLTYVEKEPAELSEEDVRRYLIHLRDERMLAGSTRNIVVHGLRFFFARVTQYIRQRCRRHSRLCCKNKA